MMHRTSRASRTALPYALLALVVAAPMAASAQDARIHLDGLQGQEQHDQFIVKYRDDSESFRSSTQRAKSLQLASTGGRAKLQYMRRLAVGADVVKAARKLDRVEAEAMMRALASDPAVEYVEVDAIMRPDVTPNDTYFTGYQWGFQGGPGGTHADFAWNRQRGAGVVVAVVDTGRTQHPDLSPKLVQGYDFISDPGRARDGNGRDGNTLDEGDWVQAGNCEGFPADDSSWHGTHVAGTVGAVTFNGRGVAGMAPNVKIQPVRVLGKCGGTISDIADGIVWAAGGNVAGAPANRTPAEVINVSIGGSGSCGNVYQAAIDRAVNRGSVVVVSAGNDNRNSSGQRPANCKRVIAVGATGRKGGRAPYSNFGAGVDVSAPGGGGDDTTGENWILSTDNAGARRPGAANYGFKVGTSMAAPHVAGAVALMQAVRARSPAQVEQLLKQTARPYPYACGNCGRGIINAEAAVNALLGRYYASNGDRTITEGAGQIIGALGINRAGNAPASLRVGVYIRHPRPSDLIVSLQAPDGTYYRLHTKTATGIPGINTTYTVNAAAEAASGQWRLVMRDDTSGQVGVLDRWTLQF